MGTLFAFSLTSSLILAILYATYRVTLSGRTGFRMNRAILLGIYAASLCAVPACRLIAGFFPTATEEDAVYYGIPDTAAVTIGTVTDIAQAPSEPYADHLQWIVMLYIAGAAAVMVGTFMSLLKIALLIRGGERRIINGRKIIISDSIKYAPFSIGRIIVLSGKDLTDEGDIILMHENSHIRLHHWADLLTAHAICIFEWYNPAAWLMLGELRAVHEYQADASVLREGVKARDYQMLLIRKAVGARFPSLANSLNHSKLKKRIAMMYKTNDSRGATWRTLALVPAFAAAIGLTQIPVVASTIDDFRNAVNPGIPSALHKVNESASISQTGLLADSPEASHKDAAEPHVTRREPAAVPESPDGNGGTLQVEGKTAAEQVEERPDLVCEVLPEYPGGSGALMKYLAENIRYPEGSDAEGRVIVKFIVEKDGSVSNPSIMRSIAPELDAEALRVVKELKFIPGQNGGKTVRSYLNLPVSFRQHPEKSASASTPSAASSSSSRSSSKASGGSSTSTSTISVSDSDTGSGISFARSENGNAENFHYEFSDNDRIFVDGKQLTGGRSEISRQLSALNPSEIESISIDKSKRKNGADLHITMRRR